MVEIISLRFAVVQTRFAIHYLMGFLRKQIRYLSHIYIKYWYGFVIKTYSKFGTTWVSTKAPWTYNYSFVALSVSPH